MSIELHAIDLLNKWGFGDGDVIWDWAYDHGVDLDDRETTDHVALQSLVRKFLVPAIEAAGHAVEIQDLETIHNPIYASSLDGVDVPWPKGHPSQVRALEGISVKVDNSAIIAAISGAL